MDDCSLSILEDIKEIVFSNRNYQTHITFETWAGDDHSFIVKGCDDKEYRVIVQKEEL